MNDVASGFLHLLEHQAEGCSNISSGQGITLKAYMQQAVHLLNHPNAIDFGVYPYRPWDPMEICGDNLRLKALGWEPKMDQHGGLLDTIEWWRKQRNSS